MKKILLLILCVVWVVSADNPYVWYDSLGLVVELKEKYGGTITDTCTVLTIKDDMYITTHRDGLGGTYPLANYSAKIIGRVK